MPNLTFNQRAYVANVLTNTVVRRAREMVHENGGTMVDVCEIERIVAAQLLTGRRFITDDDRASLASTSLIQA